jgi:hypothetical protein
MEELPVPLMRKTQIHVLEFTHYVVRAFAETIHALCRLRVDHLYEALEFVGRAPGAGTAHGYLKGYLDPSLAKDAWAVEIGAVNAVHVRKIDLVYGCLLLLLPEMVSCLVDDEFVALVQSFMRPHDPTVSHLATRLRRHMCRKLNAEYLGTDGHNTWRAQPKKVGKGCWNMYVSMYVCVYVFTYIHICIFFYKFVCVCVCACV